MIVLFGVTYEIVPKELHDEGGVLIALLRQGIEF
jgi:hypothetical protein